MGIFLDFIEKHNRIFFIAHFIPCNHTQLQIKILNCINIGKKPFSD